MYFIHLRFKIKITTIKKPIEINGYDGRMKKKILMDDLSDGLVSWLKSVRNK